MENSRRSRLSWILGLVGIILVGCGSGKGRSYEDIAYDKFRAKMDSLEQTDSLKIDSIK